MGKVEGGIPEVEVVYRSLLIAHVDVESEEVDWGQSAAAEHLEEGR